MITVYVFRAGFIINNMPINNAVISALIITIENCMSNDIRNR